MENNTTSSNIESKILVYELFDILNISSLAKEALNFIVFHAMPGPLLQSILADAIVYTGLFNINSVLSKYDDGDLEFLDTWGTSPIELEMLKVFKFDDSAGLSAFYTIGFRLYVASLVYEAYQEISNNKGLEYLWSILYPIDDYMKHAESALYFIGFSIVLLTGQYYIDILSYSKESEVNTAYGTYLASNNNGAKEFYIMIQGDGKFSVDKTALVQSSYLSDILLRKGYDVINVNAQENHQYNMGKTYELYQQYIPNSKLKGLIINAHGSYEELTGCLSLPPKLETNKSTCNITGPSKEDFTHSFSFANNINSQELLIELYRYFKHHISTSFEVGVSSCKSGVLTLEKVQQIIPEIKCFFTGAKDIGQNMDCLHYTDYPNFVKTFLLSDETECFITKNYHEIYDQADKEYSDRYDFRHQYFYANDDI